MLAAWECGRELVVGTGSCTGLGRGDKGHQPCHSDLPGGLSTELRGECESHEFHPHEQSSHGHTHRITKDFFPKGFWGEEPPPL